MDTQDRKADQKKTSRLCSEAAKVLSLVLTGEIGNLLLKILHVVDVTTTNDRQFLCVRAGHHEQETELDGLRILAALTQVQGYLRSIIAQSVNRKHVPAFKFRYVGLLETNRYAYSKNNQ